MGSAHCTLALAAFLEDGQGCGPLGYDLTPGTDVSHRPKALGNSKHIFRESTNTDLVSLSGRGVQGSREGMGKTDQAQPTAREGLQITCYEHEQ